MVPSPVLIRIGIREIRGEFDPGKACTLDPDEARPGVAARRVSSVDGRALVVHSGKRLGGRGCGHRVHNASGPRRQAAMLSLLASRMDPPQGEGKGKHGG